jgi:hypothetical protein
MRPSFSTQRPHILLGETENQQGRQYIHNSSVFVGGPYLILLYKHHILFQIDFTAMGKNISWLKVEIVYGVEGM